MKVSSNKILAAFLITILVAQFFPYQSSEAFVSNQLASTILGAPNLSTALSFGLTSATDVEFDSSGNLWVADLDNNRVIKYSTSLVTGQAASLVIGQPNLSSNEDSNGGISTNSLNGPSDIKFDASGNLWVSDADNHRILRFDAPLTTGESASLVLGQANFVSGLANRGGSVAANTLNFPAGLYFDASGNLWAVDEDNHRVLRYDAPFTNGEAAALVLGQADFVSGSSNQSGSTSDATLSFPVGVIMDTLGNLWVSDSGNNRVLKYMPSFSTGQSASVVLGQTVFSTNASGTTSATLNGGSGLEFLSDGHLFVSDIGNSRLVHYSDGDSNPATSLFMNGGAGDIFIGQPDGVSGFCNQSSIPTSPDDNTLCFPEGLTVDPSGNLWTADFSNNRVLKFPAPLSTDMSATLVLGQQDFVTSEANRGGLSSTLLNSPAGIASGSLWVADTGNHRVLQFIPPFSTGQAASVVLGQADFVSGLANKGSTPSDSSLDAPTGLFVATGGALWVSDSANSRVLMYTPTITSNQAASVVIGQSGFTTSTLATTSTGLSIPEDVTMDSSGNLWVADTGNNRVLKYASPISSNQAASVVLGQADFVSGLSNRGLSAPAANSLSCPEGVVFDALGNLWVTDTCNSRVLKFVPLSTAASVVLGQADFVSGLSNRGLSAPTSATLNVPIETAFDAQGNLWVTDASNERVLMYSDGDTNPATSNFVSGQAASFVIGQPDFVSNEINNGGISTNTLFGPIDLAFGSLAIPEHGNHRVLVFSDQPTSTLVDFNLITSGSNTITFGSSSITTTFTASGNWENANLNIQQTDANPVTADPGTPVGKFYEVVTNSPDIISSPSVSITYTDAELGSLDEATLKIRRFDGTSWSDLTTSVNTATNTASASTPGYSIFVLTGTLNLSDTIGITDTLTTQVTFVRTVGAGGTATVPLPSGTTFKITLPPGGTVTTLTTPTEDIVNQAQFSFAGEVIDVIPPAGACATGCDITFELTQAQLTAAGETTSTIRIFHDVNNDNSFAGSNEIFVPTVTDLGGGLFRFTANIPFTSKFAVGGIRPLFLGGLSGEFAPPTFTGKAFAENEYPLTINGLGYKLDQYSNTVSTISLETGKPVQIKTLLYDPGGVTSIQHLAMYMNLRGMTRDIQYSDTYIIYDKSVPAQVSDPNGFFGSVTVTPTQVGNKLELSFDITFAKPMEKSDIMFRMWDDRRNNVDTKVFDAIVVTGPEISSTESAEPTQQTTQTTESISIPSWIKSNAGWWSDGQIGDSDFVSGIQYLINEGIMTIPETEAGQTTTQNIPAWIKSNAKWWSDGLISDSDFVSGIQWLVSNGIMRIG